MSANPIGPLPIWAQGIEGQIALVTGAGRGLGRACALALARAGARVIAVSRTREELETLVGEAAGSVDIWVEDATGEPGPMSTDGGRESG